MYDIDQAYHTKGYTVFNLLDPFMVQNDKAMVVNNQNKN